MSTEIFTLIQPNINAQAAQINNPQNNNSQAQPGLFESLINNLTGTQEIINPEQIMQVRENLMTFKNNSSFPQSVIDILAGLNNENLESQISALPQDKQTQILQALNKFFESSQNPANNDVQADPLNFIAHLMNDETIKAQILSLPEDKQTQILQAVNEFIESAQNNQDSSVIQEKQEKLFAVLSENLNLPQNLKPSDIPVRIPEKSLESYIIPESDEDESDSESEIESEQNETPQANIFAAVPVNIPADNETSTKPANDVTAHIAPHKNLQTHENLQTPAKSDAKTESTQTTNFDDSIREIPGESESESQPQANNNNNQDSGNKNFNGNNFTNARENFTSSRTQSRNINNARRTESNQPERANNNRTESHSSFQTFFEGVLANRRTASQNSPTPLNLRANLEFTPSANLRDGVVNVIRFIRADGVQKANIVIDPPALGRISIELTSNSSGVEASIKVASEQIRQLVQDQLTQLRMNLSQQGVQVTDFSVDVQQDNQQGQGQNQSDNPYYRAFNNGAGDESDSSEEFRVDLEEGLLYWVA
ncbi:MAG: flagellar hook-length control protein FliK [Synergistaceae bacterium]|nr:flagellar hook-length control protein FliK [Synergistaceae bacterium]